LPARIHLQPLPPCLGGGKGVLPKSLWAAVERGCPSHSRFDKTKPVEFLTLIRQSGRMRTPALRSFGQHALKLCLQPKDNVFYRLACWLFWRKLDTTMERRIHAAAGPRDGMPGRINPAFLPKRCNFVCRRVQAGPFL
jgi:hypothetical protein